MKKLQGAVNAAFWSISPRIHICVKVLLLDLLSLHSEHSVTIKYP